MDAFFRKLIAFSGTIVSQLSAEMGNVNALKASIKDSQTFVDANR